ncbi:unnamed protein product [Closterium sp. NIES-54]
MADPTSRPVIAHHSTTLPCPADPSGSLTGFHVPSFSRNLVGVRPLVSQHVGVWFEPFEDSATCVDGDTYAPLTSLWTGSPGVASRFRVWGCFALACDTSADKPSPRVLPCVFLGFLEDSSDFTFYHPPFHRFLDSRDIRFDESVPYYTRYPCRGLLVSLPPLFLTPTPPPAPPSPQQPSTLPPLEAADPEGAGVHSADPGGATSRGVGVGAESVPAPGPGARGAGVGAEPMSAGGSSLRGAGVRRSVTRGATTGGAGAPSAGPGELGTGRVAAGGAGSRGARVGAREASIGATSAGATAAGGAATAAAAATAGAAGVGATAAAGAAAVTTVAAAATAAAGAAAAAYAS